MSFNYLLNFIFPAWCNSCQHSLMMTEEIFFCSGCWEKIRLINHCCSLCGKPVWSADGLSPTGGYRCGECRSRKQHYFSQAYSVAHYEGVLRKAIHLFKYRGKSFLARQLGQLMVAYIARRFETPEFDLVLPIPLHINRLKKRGFNQSYLLAREVAQAFHLTLMAHNLERTNFSLPQVGLKRKERLANVRQAFWLKYPKQVTGKRILLIDDVYTTGATVRECARVLLPAKVAKVEVLTLARG